MNLCFGSKSVNFWNITIKATLPKYTDQDASFEVLSVMVKSFGSGKKEDKIFEHIEGRNVQLCLNYISLLFDPKRFIQESI